MRKGKLNMERHDDKLKYGNFDTFYAALVDSSKKDEPNNFILNDPIENYIYLKFLFDNVDEIDIFVENLDYLIDTYNKAEVLVEGDDKRKQVLHDFWKSFESYMSKKQNSLQFIYKNSGGTDKFKEQDRINKILLDTKSVSGLQLYVLRDDLSIVEGLNFFLLVPKYSMVLTVQKMGDETFHVCYFHNEELYKSVKDIFGTFVKLSARKVIIIQDDNGGV